MQVTVNNNLKPNKKNKFSKSCCLTVFFVAFVLIVLAIVFLPSLATKAYIQIIAKSQPEHIQIEKFDTLRLGLFFDSVKIENLKVKVKELAVLDNHTIELDSMYFKSLGAFKYYQFVFKAITTKKFNDFIIARDLNINNLKLLAHDEYNFNFSADSLNVKNLVAKNIDEFEILLDIHKQYPIFFDLVEFKNFSYYVSDSFKASFASLDVYNYSENEIGSFKLNGVGLNIDNNKIIELEDLTVINLDLTTFAIKDEVLRSILLLLACDFFDLSSLKINFFGFVDNIDYLNAEKITFDDRMNGAEKHFKRYVKAFAIGVEDRPLNAESKIFWNIFNNKITFNLDTDAVYEEESRKFKLQNLNLNSENLFNLDLNVSLNNVMPINKNIRKQALFGSIILWSIQGGEITYTDNGFFKDNFYKILKEFFYTNLKDDKVEIVFKEDLLNFFKTIKEDKRIENINIIETELLIFFNDPKSFKISITPTNDVALGIFYGSDMYNILKNLNLSIQINERAPLNIVINESIK